MDKKVKNVDPRLNSMRDPLLFEGMEPFKMVDGDGEVIISLKVTEKMKNPFGIMHGGMIFTLSDICSGMAAHALGYDTSTMQASINYVRPGLIGDTIKAKSTVIHHGKTTMVFRIDVSNHKGKPIASSSFTMAKIRKRQL